MKKFVRTELERLRGDFVEITGEPFNHFYCPVLFRDQDTKLCQAHIINEAFADSTRACTVQRADVDNFYGSRFEADFVDIARFKDASPQEIVTDRALSKRFNARIFLNDNQVPYFHGTQDIPEKFSRVRVGNLDPSLPFGLKMQAADVKAAEGKGWEIEISRDLRLPMLVATIKAAHLSLFKLLGYRYALSAGGNFVGRSILGEFFLQNHKTPKQKILEAADGFFRTYVHMVRPIISTSFNSQGTITDRILFMCMGGSGVPWASIIFVKMGDLTHGVMIPSFQHPDQVATFLSFLENDNSSIQVASCLFAGDKWEVSRDTTTMTWPKDGLLYP